MPKRPKDDAAPPKGRHNIKRVHQDITKLDARQAAFVRFYLSNGGKAAEAYVKAYRREGIGEAAANKGARQMLRLPAVKLAIKEANDAAIEATNTKLADAGARYATSKVYIMERLAHLAFSDIRAYLKWDKKGKITLKPSDQLTDAESFAIIEIQQIFHKDGRTSIRLKLADKRQAIGDLAKIAGFLMVEIAADKSTDDDPEIKEARRLTQQRFLEALERLAKPEPLTIDATKDLEFIVENATPKNVPRKAGYEGSPPTTNRPT